MPAVLPRKRWLPAAALGLLAVACALGGGQAGLYGLRDSGRETVEAPAPLSLPPQRTLTAATPARERTHSVATGLPLDLRTALERDTDLYRYAQQLRRAGEDGNPEARWVASRIYDYCAGYALDPGGYALDDQLLASLDLEVAPGLRAARERVGQRCTGFIASDGLGRGIVVTQRRLAAENGHLAAEASLLALGEPLQDDPGYRRALVERVLDSRDPEAYLALSPAMGVVASGDDAMRGLVAGSQFAELAWQVAACQLGLACGPDSVLMDSYCANAGICSSERGQDFVSFVYDAAVPRQGAGKMSKWVDSLRNGRGVEP